MKNEPSLRDVTGEDDEDHFGPPQRKSRRVEEEDSYESPKRNSSPSREESSEKDIQKAKQEYSDDDFKGEIKGGSEFETVPEDIYEVVCKDVIPTTMADKFKGGEMVPKIKMVFEIINDKDFEGVSISRILNRNFAQKSNLVEWYTKITGESVEKGNSIDIRKCKGKECRVSVTVYKKEDGEKRNKITEVHSKKRRA